MRLLRQHRRHERGSALIEIAMSYGTLVIVALLTLKASVNATSNQAWTIKQAMSDAFVTRESAMASRVPFEVLTGGSSQWPLFPSVASSTVTIGRLPGGQLVTGTVHRTRIPDPNNLPSAGGTGTTVSNPASTEAWEVQSILSYNVGTRTYIKSRTVLRIR
jgi:hypothetical protein